MPQRCRLRRRAVRPPAGARDRRARGGSRAALPGPLRGDARPDLRSDRQRRAGGRHRGAGRPAGHSVPRHPAQRADPAGPERPRRHGAADRRAISDRRGRHRRIPGAGDARCARRRRQPAHGLCRRDALVLGREALRVVFVEPRQDHRGRRPGRADRRSQHVVARLPHGGAGARRLNGAARRRGGGDPPLPRRPVDGDLRAPGRLALERLSVRPAGARRRLPGTSHGAAGVLRARPRARDARTRKHAGDARTRKRAGDGRRAPGWARPGGPFGSRSRISGSACCTSPSRSGRRRSCGRSPT